MVTSNREHARLLAVCRRWYALCHDPVLRRRLDASVVPLSGIRIWRLLRHQVTGGVHELKLRGCFLYRSRWGPYAKGFHSLSPSLHSFTLAELRRRCPALLALTLADMALAFDSTGAPPAIADLPVSLRRLALRACSFQAVGFFHRDPHQLLSRLELLDLADCVQTDGATLALLAERASSLRALGLERCRRLDGENLRRLGSSLLGRLRVLDLEGCPLDDDALAAVLGSASSLEQLYLANTPLTEGALRRSPVAPSLQRLCVRGLPAALLEDVCRVAPLLCVLLVDEAQAAAMNPVSLLPRGFRLVVAECQKGELADTCGHFLGGAVRRALEAAH
ncbi:hypothetical protein V5799_030018 [Amblyomma americanum]|uniref:Uncharacterized protein n=1 Tax=Amblyomma americanum TaxID=6943 RepID=A0AAQ4EQ03_AMBAM